MYEKQDCELKAFARLADKLKRFFPHLPICIHADGLYPNRTFFSICAAKNWRFLVTLKDGNLKLLWEEIDMELLTNKNERRTGDGDRQQTYRWLESLSYHEFRLSWIECVEAKKDKSCRFAYVTDLSVGFAFVIELGESGRLRFKIENEGFNTLKNGGYALEHKFSRTSYAAAKNYVSLMQIAHLFNQLYLLSSLARPLLVAKLTIKYLWKRLISALYECEFADYELARISLCRFQIRYE